MGRKALLSLILITTVGLASALALAHGGGGKYRSYGMGPGMMGMGHMGMMGGMGHMGMMGDPGMMGGMGPLHMLDLSDEQWAKIRTIQAGVRKQHWQAMGKIMDESSVLQELFAVDKPDSKKIGAVYDKIFALRRQMIESGIEAHNQIEAVLTKEQHEQLEQMHRGRGDGMPGMMGPGMHHRGMMGG